MTQKTTRRTFLTTSVAVTGGIIGGAALQQNLTSASKDQPSVTTNQPPIATAIPERELGNTGVRVPIFGLGGAGQTPLSWDNREKDAVAIVERALQLGIRYFDTAASYGPSEDNLGNVLPAYRDKIF